MNRTAFLAHQDMTNFILLVKLVVNRKNRTARISKYQLDVLIDQGLGDHLCTRHYACHKNSPIADLTALKGKQTIIVTVMSTTNQCLFNDRQYIFL